MIIAFWIFSVLTVLAALGVVFSTKPLHSALWLVATLFLVAVHYAMMGADFIAALQVVIYAGAIMVLVVFVIILLGLDEGSLPAESKLPRYGAGLVCGVFAGLMLFAFNEQFVFPLAAGTVQEVGGGHPREVGMVLLSEYLYASELIALLLLAAIIGAVVLAY